MRTEAWVRARVARASQVVLRSRRSGSVDLRTVRSAFRAVTDDSPPDNSARLVAEALGVLHVREWHAVTLPVSSGGPANTSSTTR